MNVTLEPLDGSNWLKVCELSVSKKQKKIFTVPNVYWIGISRYEEKPSCSPSRRGTITLA